MRTSVRGLAFLDSFPRLVLVRAIVLSGCSDAAPSSSPSPSHAPAIGSPSEGPRPRHPRSRSVDAQRYEALADHVRDAPTEDEPWTLEVLEATVDIAARGRMGEAVDAGGLTITLHDVFTDVEPKEDRRDEPGTQWVLRSDSLRSKSDLRPVVSFRTYVATSKNPTGPSSAYSRS